MTSEFMQKRIKTILVLALILAGPLASALTTATLRNDSDGTWRLVPVSGIGLTRIHPDPERARPEGEWLVALGPSGQTLTLLPHSAITLHLAGATRPQGWPSYRVVDEAGSNPDNATLTFMMEAYGPGFDRLSLKGTLPTPGGPGLREPCLPGTCPDPATLVLALARYPGPAQASSSSHPAPGAGVASGQEVTSAALHQVTLLQAAIGAELARRAKVGGGSSEKAQAPAVPAPCLTFANLGQTALSLATGLAEVPVSINLTHLTGGQNVTSDDLPGQGFRVILLPPMGLLMIHPEVKPSLPTPPIHLMFTVAVPADHPNQTFCWTLAAAPGIPGGHRSTLVPMDGPSSASLPFAWDPGLNLITFMPNPALPGRLALVNPSPLPRPITLSAGTVPFSVSERTGTGVQGIQIRLPKGQIMPLVLMPGSTVSCVPMPDPGDAHLAIALTTDGASGAAARTFQWSLAATPGAPGNLRALLVPLGDPDPAGLPFRWDPSASRIEFPDSEALAPTQDRVRQILDGHVSGLVFANLTRSAAEVNLLRAHPDLEIQTLRAKGGGEPPKDLPHGKAATLELEPQGSLLVVVRAGTEAFSLTLECTCATPGQPERQVMLHWGRKGPSEGFQRFLKVFGPNGDLLGKEELPAGFLWDGGSKLEVH